MHHTLIPPRDCQADGWRVSAAAVGRYYLRDLTQNSVGQANGLAGLGSLGTLSKLPCQGLGMASHELNLNVLLQDLTRLFLRCLVGEVRYGKRDEN